MGLFGHKQPAKPADDAGTVDDQQKHFFDEYYREELRNHGRWYFEKIINENAALFKQDLDATIEQVSTTLKERMTTQLDEQLAGYKQAMQEAQATAVQALTSSASELQQQQKQMADTLQKSVTDHEAELLEVLKQTQEVALKSLHESTEALQTQQQQLSDALQKNISTQEALLSGEIEENRARIAAMKDAQGAAIRTLQSSAEALQTQQQQLSALLQRDVAAQEAVLIRAFEENMARIVEKYLLEALGNQYDLKAQLPAIIQQLSTNKQAIVDDMKL